MDGLLLDTERIALAAFVEACEHFSLSDHTPVFYQCIGTNQESGIEVLRRGLDRKVDHLAFRSVWDSKYIEATSVRPVPLKHGVKDLLKHLGRLRIPAAVATSTRSAQAVKKLDSAGIAHHFAAIVGGDQVERSKPHPDIYLHAATTLRVRPEACLALEDSENGVRAAVSAGMWVIQVPDLVAPSPALMQLGHVVLESLEHVRTFAFGSGQAES